MKEIPKKVSSGSEQQKSRSQVVENPCTQIFQFMRVISENKRDASFQSHDKNRYFNRVDYGSDEFADVEDNAKDSSSDSNSESTSDVKLAITEMKVFSSGTGIESQMVKPNENRTLEECVTVSSSSSQEIVGNKDGKEVSEGKISITDDINVGATCSFLLDNNTSSVPGIPHEGNKIKLKMPTIAEVAELEDINLKRLHSSYERANPLKMKTKVGMRKDKCNVCRVRLGLCAIRCRCGGYYCAKHRYDKEHNCTFDYRAMGAEEIRKNNPRVTAEKVRKL